MSIGHNDRVIINNKFIIVGRLTGGISNIIIVDDTRPNRPRMEVEEVLLRQLALRTALSGEDNLLKEALKKRFSVLKIINNEYIADKEMKERFVEEAKSLAMLNSPYVVELYEVISEDDNIYLLMEYCEGGNLRERLKDGPLPLEDALKYAIQICIGLNYCQEVFPGLTHRDLKPENLLFHKNIANIVVDGNEEFIKIADFGIAQQKTPSLNLTQINKNQIFLDDINTSNGNILGTLPYMSPEQLQDTDVDVRSDIYTFGIILLEMLTGIHPFKGDPADIAKNIISNEWDRSLLSVRLPNLNDEVKYIITKCLSKNPTDRFQNWMEILEYWHSIIEPFSDSSVFDLPRDISANATTKKRFVIKSESILRAWAFFWPDEYPKKKNVYTMKNNSAKPIFVRDRAQSLYKMNKEKDAIKVIDELLTLPIDAEEALRFIITLINQYKEDPLNTPHPDIIKDLLIIRGKCFSDALEREHDPDIIPNAITNAILLSSLYGDDPHSLCLASQIFMIIKNFDIAEKLLYLALDINKDDQYIKFNFDQFWTRKGFHFQDLGNIENALICFDKLIEHESNNPRAWYNKGVICLNAQRLDDALSFAEKSKELAHLHANKLICAIRVEVIERNGRTHPNKERNELAPELNILQNIEQTSNLVIKYITQGSWKGRLNIITEHPEVFLSGLASPFFNLIVNRYQDDKGMIAVVSYCLLLIELCQKHSTFEESFNEFISIIRQTITKSIILFINSETLDKSKMILKSYEYEIFLPMADMVFDELIEDYHDDPETVDVIKKHKNLLVACREEGIDKIYSDLMHD